MPTLTVAGGAGPIHVVDLHEESPTPSGELPIVFVHGMVGHTGFWKAALAACADRRRAIAIDLRGHGNSKPPSDGDYSVEGCATDVLAVFDALGLESVVLVGHSYGAHVVIEAAARQPSRVRRLILVDPPGDFTTWSAQMREEQILPYLASMDGDNWRAVVESDFDDALVGGTSATAAAIHARLATMPHDAMRSMARGMMNFGAKAALERYLVHPGSSVHAILAPPNAWPFSLHLLVPAITTTVVPDVGHWIMLDAPERFIRALEEAVADGGTWTAEGG
jgi:pimeloyl-ACP methyl ester carboxylesterase